APPRSTLFPYTTLFRSEDIGSLRHMFDEFLNSAPAEHIDEYSDANIAFHQAIIRLSGSHLMGKTIENLFIHVRAIRRMTISQRRSEEHTSELQSRSDLV